MRIRSLVKGIPAPIYMYRIKLILEFVDKVIRRNGKFGLYFSQCLSFQLKNLLPHLADLVDWQPFITLTYQVRMLWWIKSGPELNLESFFDFPTA